MTDDLSLRRAAQASVLAAEAVLACEWGGPIDLARIAALANANFCLRRALARDAEAHDHALRGWHSTDDSGLAALNRALDDQMDLDVFTRRPPIADASHAED